MLQEEKSTHRCNILFFSQKLPTMLGRRQQLFRQTKASPKAQSLFTAWSVAVTAALCAELDLSFPCFLFACSFSELYEHIF